MSKHEKPRGQGSCFWCNHLCLLHLQCLSGQCLAPPSSITKFLAIAFQWFFSQAHRPSHALHGTQRDHCWWQRVQQMWNWDLSLPFTEHLSPVPKNPKTILVTLNTSLLLLRLPRQSLHVDRCPKVGMQKELSQSLLQLLPRCPLVQTPFRLWICSCTTHTGLAFRKDCGEVWSPANEGTLEQTMEL